MYSSKLQPKWITPSVKSIPKGEKEGVNESLATLLILHLRFLVKNNLLSFQVTITVSKFKKTHNEK